MKLWMVLALFGLVALTVGVHAEDEGEAAPESEPEDTPETAATAEESEVTEVKASPASGDDDTAEDPTAEPGDYSATVGPEGFEDLYIVDSPEDEFSVNGASVLWARSSLKKLSTVGMLNGGKLALVATR